jgi:hypothetical protein
VLNATGLGSLKLADVLDVNLFPTRGQTVLVAEPRTPIKRMYEFERKKYKARLYVPLYNSTLKLYLLTLCPTIGIIALRNESIQIPHTSSLAHWVEV